MPHTRRQGVWRVHEAGHATSAAASGWAGVGQHGRSTRTRWRGVQQARAARVPSLQATSEGHYKLAHDMLKRCVAYYDTLGQHWLGTTRKFNCMRLIHICESNATKTYHPVEQAARETKRAAIRALGPNNRAAMDAAWFHADQILQLKRHEQAMSMFQQGIRVRQSVLGPKHATVFKCQVRVRLTMHLTWVGICAERAARGKVGRVHSSKRAAGECVAWVDSLCCAFGCVWGQRRAYHDCVGQHAIADMYLT